MRPHGPSRSLIYAHTLFGTPSPTLLSLVPRTESDPFFDGYAGLQWVASSCNLCPHRLLNTLSDLHRPHCRTKRAAIPNRVCLQHPFPTTPLIYLSIYPSISRWESPPYTSVQFSVPDNWKSGRIWVRIFLFSSITAGAWLHSLADFCGRARARFFLVDFQGRRDCNFTTTDGASSCLDGGCNGGLQCDPHSGTVRLSPTIFTYTQLTLTLCPPFALFPLRAAQGVAPATVAEWTLQGNGSQDFYDGA